MYQGGGIQRKNHRRGGNYGKELNGSSSSSNSDLYSPVQSHSSVPREDDKSDRYFDRRDRCGSSDRYQSSSDISNSSVEFQASGSDALETPKSGNRNDTNNNKSVLVKPPKSVVNIDPHQHQLLERLLPRHVSYEHVVFSHKIKIGGRSLYFFSPSSRGGLTKPVFTTKEKLTLLIDGPVEEEDSEEHSSSSWPRPRLGSGGGSPRKKREELVIPGGLCTIKRIHLTDPACDIGVSIWLGRGPQRGLSAPQRPISGLGPALLVEVHHDSRYKSGMAVAAGFNGELMYLVPLQVAGKAEMEPRTTEIFVQDCVLMCVCESVLWFSVKSFTRKKVTVAQRQLSSQRLAISKFAQLRTSDNRKATL